MADLWMDAVKRASERLRCGSCNGPVTVNRVIAFRSASWVCTDCQWAICTWDAALFLREYGHG